MSNFKIVELILDEDQEMAGIEAISIVEHPAIEEEFIALKSEEIKLAEVSAEKKILMGALLVPNKPIYRRNGDDEYYIYFSKDTVLKASQMYLMKGNQNNSTMEHQYELSGLSLVESWIVEDEVHDKSRKYGMNVPIGTWMGSVKVNNDEVWEKFVKTGKVKGFSIEGYFADKMETPKKRTGMSEQEQDALNKIEELKALFKKKDFSSYKVDLTIQQLQSKLDKAVADYDKALNQVRTTAANSFQRSAKLFGEVSVELSDYIKKASELGAKDAENEFKRIKKVANNYEIDAKIFADAAQNFR